MAKWTKLDIGGDTSQNDPTDHSEESLNEEMLEDDTQTDAEEESDISDEEVDFTDLEQEDEEVDNENVNSLDDEEKIKKQKSEQAKKTSRSEERIRELVAQKKAAEAKAQAALKELEEERKASTQNRKQSIDSDIVATKNALANVEAALKAAVDGGDTEALIKNQKLLSENTVRLMALESQKANFEAEQKKAPVKTTTTQANQEESAQEVPEEALNWAKKNDGWFNKNRALTGTALGINQDLLEEGYDPESTEFYQELDKRLAPYKPKNSTTAKKPSGESLKQKGTQVVGSSSKSVPQKSVKVTPQDAQRARRLGISPQTYLKQKAAYERNSQNELSTFKPIFIDKNTK